MPVHSHISTYMRTHTHTRGPSCAQSALCSHQASPGKINYQLEPTRNPPRLHVTSLTHECENLKHMGNTVREEGGERERERVATATVYIYQTKYYWLG